MSTHTGLTARFTRAWVARAVRFAPLVLLAAIGREPAGLAALPTLTRCYYKARRTLATIRQVAGPHLLGP